MTSTLEELLISARKLTNRLKEDETTTDMLINQAKNTQQQIDAIKQYSDDVEKLNEAASQRPHSVLVAGLQRECQHLRELQAENYELRSALGDHQNAIELIMSKYRQQISQLLSQNKVDINSFYDKQQCTQIVMDQYAQINKMRRLMREAAEADEESSIKDQELISKLITENRGLREMLNIYLKYGSQEPTKETVTDENKTPEN